jgi:hypothetical protein
MLWRLTGIAIPYAIGVLIGMLLKRFCRPLESRGTIRRKTQNESDQ